MDKQEITDLIEQMIDNDNQVNQFGVAQTSFHTHNGADSSLLQFTKLKDVPNSYNGSAGKSVMVNSTENALEFNTPLTVYAGKVDSGGTTGTLPTGWSVAHNGTGDYTVTHNLGVAGFPVVSSAGVAGFQVVVASGTTTFQVATYNTSAAATDLDWYFHFSL